MNARERMLRVLRGEKVDRPPVAYIGGMMNAAIVEIVESSGVTLPAAHFDAAQMATLALAVADRTGFENLALPFCMTVEPEALGSEINPGTLACEPKIAREIYPSCADVPVWDTQELLHRGRIDVIIEAVKKLRAARPDLPLIYGLTGPISTAASVVDPPAYFKELRKKPEEAHRVTRQVTEFLSAFARALITAGADVVAIGDPSATGEILGPKLFAAYAAKYLRELTDAIHAAGTPTIVHICGDTGACRQQWRDINADAISVDAMINLASLKGEFPDLKFMGNVSTFLLEFGPAEKVAATTQKLIRDGVDIIAPACGLSTSTKLNVIHALTDTVRGGQLNEIKN